MPLVDSGSRQAVSENIGREMDAGKPHNQAVAIALDVARRYGRHLASGGDVGPILPMLNAARREGQAKRLAAGGSAGAPAQMPAITTPSYAPAVIPQGPQAPSYGTAAPAVNQQGFVPVPQVGSYNLDQTTGALTPSSQAALQQFAQRGLTIGGVKQGVSTKDPNNTGNTGASTTPTIPPGSLANLFAQEDAGRGWRGGAMKGYAVGGVPTSGEMAPWFTRSEAHGEDHPGGLIHGIGPGRTDNTPMVVAAGSHVIPADVVSGLGEGNTMAGAHAMDVATRSGPGGIKLPSGPHRASIPRPPSLGAMGPKFAKGGEPNWQGQALRCARGGAPNGVRCIVANGEYLLTPAEVERITHNGKRGHDAVDDWILERRKATVAKMKALPGPVKS